MSILKSKNITNIFSSVSFAISILIGFSPANAVSIVIDNSGFEEPDLANQPPVIGDEVFTFEIPPGWQLYDPSNLIADNPNLMTSFVGVWNPTSTFFVNQAPEGKNVGAILLAQEPGSGVAGFTQTLSSTLEANTKYTLQVEVGNPGDFFAGFPGYRIQLLAGGAVIAQDDNTLSPSEGTFESSTISFTTSDNENNLGQQLEIRLLNILDDSGLEIDFDNVRLNATSVPEPISTLSILTFSTFGVASTLNRKLKLSKSTKKGITQVR